MKTSMKYRVGGLLGTSALAIVVVPVSTASATAGFTCPDGTGNNARTDVRFTQTGTNDRVELIYEPGKTVIK